MDRMTYRLQDQNGEPTDTIVLRIEYDNYKYQYADDKTKYELVLKQLAKYEEDKN